MHWHVYRALSFTPRLSKGTIYLALCSTTPSLLVRRYDCMHPAYQHLHIYNKKGRQNYLDLKTTYKKDKLIKDFILSLRSYNLVLWLEAKE